MATRSSIPGTKSGATDSLSVAEFNDLPGGLIGKVTVTAQQSGLSSIADLTGLTLTLTPSASRVIRIVATCRLYDNTANEYVSLRLQKDGTTIADNQSYVGNATSVSVTVPCTAIDDSPTAASHTYKLQGGRGSGAAGSITLDASSTQPAVLLIFDDGPTF